MSVSSTTPSPATEPGAGLCLDPHDLAAAKLAAGRQKDFDFVAALLQVGIIDPRTAVDRVMGLGHLRDGYLRVVARAEPSGEPEGGSRREAGG
jgi:hypothetical protein